MALFGNTNNVNGGGGDYNTSSSGANVSQNSSEGLPKTWNAGVHYDNKWFRNDGFSIAGDYRVAKSNMENSSNSQTKYILPDTQYISRQNVTSFTSGTRHSLNASSEIKPDSSTTVKVSVNAGKSTGSQKSRNYSETVTLSEQQLSSQIQEQSSNSDATSAITDIFYGRRLGAPGRTLSINLRNDYNNSNTAGLFNSRTSYGTAGAGDTLNQRKTSNSLRNTTLAKAVYTQPLSKMVFLEFNYEFNFNSNTSTQLSYDLPAGDNNPEGSFEQKLQQRLQDGHHHEQRRCKF